MKTFLGRVSVLLLLLTLTACVDLNDPWGRIQGEPTESDGVAVIDEGESGPAGLTVEPEDEVGEAAGAEEEHDEGH